MAENRGESSAPLLNSLEEQYAGQSSHSRHVSSSSGTYRRRSTCYHIFKKWWKPLAALSTPFILLFIYALVNPHVPGLPPLPKVTIQHGGTTYGGNIDTAGGSGQMNEVLAEDPCNCGSTREGERLCSIYQPEGLMHSRAVQGTGARIRRVLQKARDGERLKVGVLGGSVSACHGLHPSPQYPQGDPGGPGCYTSLVSSWLNTTFPDVKHEFSNGAIGGMDSSYYAFCGTHHIATDTDLIILEFDVNDQPELTYQSFFDQLLRVLLEFRSQPAVVILGAWSPQVAVDLGYADPQIIHLPIAQFRDVPYVSEKRLLFNNFLRFPHSTAKTFYLPDMLHPNARGHRVLADLLIAYLETELCRLNRWGLPWVPDESITISTTKTFDDLIEVDFPLDPPHMIDPLTPPEGWEETFNLEPLSKLTSEIRHFVLPTTPYDIAQVGMFTPLRDVIDPKKSDPTTPSHILNLPQPEMFCVDANDRENPMKPTTHEGWEPFVWNGEKHFWVSSTVGARIRVEIKVNAGRVAVYYYRSRHYDLGDALCWVDDNEKGAVRLAGYWDKQYNVAVVAYIDEKVTPGDHYVTCKISSNSSHPDNPSAHNWRLVAVMAT